MPKKKITHEVRKKMVSDVLDGNQTQASIAAKYDVNRRTISGDKRKNALLWKSEAVEMIRRELTGSAEQLLYAERHLKQRASTDDEFGEFIDGARTCLSVLDARLKRVKKLFRTDN